MYVQNQGLGQTVERQRGANKGSETKSVDIKRCLAWRGLPDGRLPLLDFLILLQSRFRYRHRLGVLYRTLGVIFFACGARFAALVLFRFGGVQSLFHLFAGPV